MNVLGMGKQEKVNVVSVEAEREESVESVATTKSLKSRCVDESHWNNCHTTAKVPDRQNAFFISLKAQHHDRHLFSTSFILIHGLSLCDSRHFTPPIPTCLHTLAPLFSTLSPAHAQIPPLHLSLLLTT